MKEGAGGVEGPDWLSTVQNLHMGDKILINIVSYKGVIKKIFGSLPPNIRGTSV